ncbi:vitamin D3 receptor-like [Amphiura filiformis]|uniref:vitamin D3 receptor-like n=1 Tax=Amphiura filiformis TaxID=82378 RepID=UPI003B2158AD
MASEEPEQVSVKSPPKEDKKGAESKEDRICLVCGDRANGVHYNVLSCEGCKSFFLRSAKSKAVFTCSQGGTCSMDLYTRRHCPACRMQRCKELGMSLDRVWDNERLKTRKPLIRTKRKKKVPPAKSPPTKIPAMESIPTSSGLPVSPGMVTTFLPLSTPPAPAAAATAAATAPPVAAPPAAPAVPVPQLTQEQLDLLEGLERGYTASKEVFKNIFPRASPIVDQDGNPSTDGSTSKEETTMPLSAATDSASSALAAAAAAAEAAGVSIAGASASFIDNQFLQQLQADVGADGAMGLMSSDPAIFSSSLQRVTSFITNGNMSMMQETQGKPKLQICKELLHIAMDMFAILVKQTIHFAKTIPGFVDLTCDDQAVLIKASIIDALLLRCAESYAPDKNCLINDMNGEMFSMKMMYQLGYTTFLEPAFQFMRETKACGLSTAEYALLNGVAILSPDRTELRNRELVEQMQQNLILTLYQSTKVYHGSDKTLFAKLIMKLTTLRDIAVVHLSDLMEVKVREGDLSPLIAEIFGLEGT